MTLKKYIIIAVACLDVMLVILGQRIGYAEQVISSMVHSSKAKYNWYYKPRMDGLQPERNSEMEFVYNYNAYSVGNPREKIIYLTFDAGFENGYTESILDTLKEHDVKVTFFLVGHYLESSPEIVRRMVEQGHTVGNHTMNHKDMSNLNFDAFKKEITDFEELYFDLIGKPLKKYYRPPSGTFSEQSLKYAKDLGYSTIFWSFAYCDWYVDDQPSQAFAIDKIISRTHPGEVVLLHSTSQTNALVLGEVIAQWKSMGYRFESLDHLTQ